MSNLINPSEEVKNKPTIRTLPAVVFGLWLLVWLGAEFVTAADMNPDWIHRVFIGLIVVFLIPEVWGAVSKRKGDTFSELIWVFIADGSARKIVGAALAAALTFRAASIPYLVQDSKEFLVLDLPWWIMCAGIFGWLVRHFPELGKRG